MSKGRIGRVGSDWSDSTGQQGSGRVGVSRKPDPSDPDPTPKPPDVLDSIKLDPHLAKVRDSLAKVFGAGIVWFQQDGKGGKHQGGGVFGVGDKAVRLRVETSEGGE